MFFNFIYLLTFVRFSPLGRLKRPLANFIGKQQQQQQQQEKVFFLATICLIGRLLACQLKREKANINSVV